MLFAITLQLSSSTVEAGVIVTAGSLTSCAMEASSSRETSESSQPDQGEQSSVFDFRNDSDLGGNADFSPVNVRIVSLPIERVAFDVLAGLCWRAVIENSELPGLPTLGGLLKPS
ncbi:hypothetical protein [Roseimaritima ulvae]|uniref:hypothetical protein n=1 Tax=Roseimaritima ulvae TaxID=980254 RepID=UPI0011CE37CE|nr:hypothetical protein [Roseimaritima ulvae]